MTISNDNNKSARNDTKFNTDVLIELRDTARGYKKLDYAYIAAAGAIIATFKLKGYPLYEFTSQFWTLIVIFIGVFLYDTLVESFFFEKWIDLKTGKQNIKLSDKILLRLSGSQSLIHFIFISLIVLGVAAFSKGSIRAINDLAARAEIQSYVNKYIDNHKTVPASIEQVIKVYPNVEKYHEVLEKQPIRIKSQKKNKYVVTFSGNDKKLDTDDDSYTDDTIKLMDIYEKLYGK